MIDIHNHDRVLVDSNVVIYAHDPSDLRKHEIASDLLLALSASNQLVFTNQVLNEFCSVMMRPNRPVRLSPDMALEVVRDLRSTGEVLLISVETTIRALIAMPIYRLSFWDALIWASAKENGISVIYTEDTQSAPVIEGVRYINPFAAAS